MKRVFSLSLAFLLSSSVYSMSLETEPGVRAARIDDESEIVMALDGVGPVEASDSSGDGGVVPADSAWADTRSALEEVEPKPVPEPFAGLMILVGLCLVFMLQRRRNAYGG